VQFYGIHAGYIAELIFAVRSRFIYYFGDLSGVRVFQYPVVL